MIGTCRLKCWGKRDGFSYDLKEKEMVRELVKEMVRDKYLDGGQWREGEKERGIKRYCPYSRIFKTSARPPHIQIFK